MQQVASFDITLVATDLTVPKAGKRLMAAIHSVWAGLSQLVPSHDVGSRGAKPRPLPGYYGSAYAAANAGVPVATFRGLA